MKSILNKLNIIFTKACGVLLLATGLYLNLLSFRFLSDDMVFQVVGHLAGVFFLFFGVKYTLFSGKKLDSVPRPPPET